MADLTDEMKVFIVTALAHFKRPIEVIESLKEEFGVKIEPDQVTRYNPLRASFQGKEEYRQLFDEARKAYVEDVSSEPIANQGFRLKELRELYQRAKKAKNYVLAAALLEQVAKEVGGALTNERIHRSDGKPMQPDQMQPGERREAIMQLFVDALAARGKTVHEGSSATQ